jgi:Rrf2 family protein
MRLSTKSRFAVTAMIDVALREDRGPVSLSAISERHQISLSYLEQLFSKLRQHHLVESTRGPGGGYSLARSAEKITMADIVSAVDFSAESEDAGSSEAGNWMSSDLWASLNEKNVGAFAVHQLAPVGVRAARQRRHCRACSLCGQARRVCQAQKSARQNERAQFGVCAGCQLGTYTLIVACFPKNALQGAFFLALIKPMNKV